jgi:predicted membrane protein
MKRMMGFALFCFSMGMLVMLVLHSRFFGFLLLVLCMIAGYYLFCCERRGEMDRNTKEREGNGW